MKKSIHVMSMLLVAVATAGAMTLGQSFAGNAETPEYGFGNAGRCTSNFDRSEMTPEQIRNLWYVD
jgi:Skp family chaperone for outer membrane proteins